MAHEIAKLLLEKAGTFLERTEAVKTVISLGMPLVEIEEYLDWLERNPSPRWGANASIVGLMDIPGRVLHDDF